MKITLQYFGRYVSAEQGGGIDTRELGAPIAMHADRSEAGPWETFDLQDLGENKYALRTCDGYYVTAENGGGSSIRTNEKAAGVWETFTLINGVFLCWDGLHALGVINATLDITAQTSPPRFTITSLEPPTPPFPELDVWKGSFCIPGAMAGAPYGDGQRIWTPAYGCYDDTWRATMRKAYRARSYTHFVYNAAGLPYANDYPELTDDPDRVARDLAELVADGLIPVVCATDDREPDRVLESVGRCSDLIPIVFPCWEQNGPLGNDTNRQKTLICNVRDAVPAAQCWLHFTPGHGAIGIPEDECWFWCQEQGTIGLLAQGGNKISNLDPVYEGKGLETTAVRLAGLVGYVVPEWDGGSVPPSWAGLHQRTVKFEWGIFESYHSRVTEADLCAFTDAFMPYCPHVSGFCDGGTVHV